MKVSLVSVTQPAFLIEGYAYGQMSPEELIVYTARVSSPQNQGNTDTAPKLIKYLIDHKHWSPFEMVDLTVEIETSRAISAQILRHRSFSFQEFSQRYADPTAIGFETYEARRQDVKNRQNSIDDLPWETKDGFKFAQEKVQEITQGLYNKAIAAGIAKEQARMLLPMSVATRLYMKGSVRSWIHYLQVRTDPSTQKEHRDVALKCLEIFRDSFPVIASVAFSC